MKKRVLFLALILSSFCALFSCGEQSDTPTGMKLVKGGDDIGYYLYVHSEWTVGNIGNIASAHVSTVDTTSISMVEINTPASGTLADYFRTQKDNFPYEINIVTDGESCMLGNIDKAYKFVFEFTYKDIKYKEMQVLATYGGRSYIFSYQSSGELVDPDTTYFDYHYEKITQIMENIKFVGKSEAPEKAPDDTNGDGYYLASDKKISGFELYVPISCKCEFSEGMVSVKISDSANISLAEATGTGVYIKDYYNSRKEAIETFAEDFTEISVNKESDGVLGDVDLGNLTTAASYEYTYSYNGEIYHVYQIFAVSRTNGYAFTYTAKQSEYTDHLDQIKEIIKRVRF